MRDDIAALEEHLKDNPEDWDAWGVYADWLSEQGDPRGAILANACKIHRLEQDPNMSAEEHRRLYEEQDRLSRDRNDVHFSIEDGHFEGVLCFPHRLVIDEPWQGRETLRRVFKRFAKHPARPYVSELVLRTVPEVAPPLEGIRRLIIERQTSYPERGSTIGALRRRGSGLSRRARSAHRRTASREKGSRPPTARTCTARSRATTANG